MRPSTQAQRRLIVAVDGPAGSGKSTLTRRLAVALGLPYINTGLMYRAVTQRALAEGLDVEQEEELVAVARSIVFSIQPGHPDELVIDGATPSDDLMSPQVEEWVSRVSRHPAVRDVLRQEQRTLGAGGGAMEGRDIGTVVFPDADAKIFLSAAPDVRADRRAQEAGRGMTAAQAVSKRDELDKRTNPLVPAPDADVIDATHLSADEVFAKALDIVETRAQQRGVRFERNG